MRLRFRTTRNGCPSGDAPLLDEVDDGGVGWLLALDAMLDPLRLCAQAAQRSYTVCAELSIKSDCYRIQSIAILVCSLECEASVRSLQRAVAVE